MNNQCFVDAVIDNLISIDKQHQPFEVCINEYGDLSGENFENVGEIKLNLINNLQAQQASTRLNRIIQGCDLNECVGRSIVINDKQKKPLAAGIIARASPVSVNTKRICVCSGKTIWAERKENLTNNSN